MAMEGFQRRRSIRLENMRLGLEASRVRPSSSSRDTIAKAKMKAEPPSKTRKYSSSKPNDNVESKSIAVTESQPPPETSSSKPNDNVESKSIAVTESQPPPETSSSKPNDNVESKSIAVTESQPPPKTTTKKKKEWTTRGPAPRRKISPFRCTLPRQTIRQYCALALKKFNAISDGGRKYVLVKPLCCHMTFCPTIYHCNFTARPKYASELIEDKLFFGELKFYGDVSNSRPLVLRCSVCSMLGDPGIETGSQGCMFCECQHPVDVGFLKNREEAIDSGDLTGLNGLR